MAARCPATTGTSSAEHQHRLVGEEELSVRILADRAKAMERLILRIIQVSISVCQLNVPQEIYFVEPEAIHSLGQMGPFILTHGDRADTCRITPTIVLMRQVLAALAASELAGY